MGFADSILVLFLSRTLHGIGATGVEIAGKFATLHPGVVNVYLV